MDRIKVHVCRFILLYLKFIIKFYLIKRTCGCVCVKVFGSRQLGYDFLLQEKLPCDVSPGASRRLSPRLLGSGSSGDQVETTCFLPAA